MSECDVLGDRSAEPDLEIVRMRSKDEQVHAIGHRSILTSCGFHSCSDELIAVCLPAADRLESRSMHTFTRELRQAWRSLLHRKAYFFTHAPAHWRWSSAPMPRCLRW